MKLNRAELRKVSYDFNSFSNRLLKADYQDYKEVLGKYLQFLSNCPIINDYLSNCGSPTIPNIESEVNTVAASFGDNIFSTGDTTVEENANIYAILRYLADSNIAIHDAVTGYSYSNKNKDIIKAFNERFVLIMIHNIEGYLTKLGIDMGLDESISYNITVTNGQVNLASDNAIIHATLNNGIDTSELKVLIEKVLSECKSAGLSEDEVVIVSESVEVIQHELIQKKPKKAVLRGIVAVLQGIKGTAEFMASTAALIQFAQPFIH